MIIDGQEIFDQGKTANCFNKFFVDIGPKLTSMIPESQAKFDQFLLTNYRPISVLSCFSKLLERLIYNRLFKYLSENSILV